MIDADDLANRCLDAYEPDDQIDKCIEEGLEYMLALIKSKKDRSSYQEIAGEYADLQFTMLQMRLLMDRKIYGLFSEMIDVEMDYKLNRQNVRLKLRDKRLNS